MGIWTKEVVKSLENNAFYNEGKILCRPSDMAIIERIKETFIPGMVLIDYACGIGRLADLLKQNGVELNSHNYIGYDSSADMIDRAKEKFPDLTFTSDLSDIDGLKFNILVNIDMLQHTKNFDEMAKQISDLIQMADISIFHFWYENIDKHEIVTINGQNFDENFPSPVTVTNKLIPDDLSKINRVRFFEGNPYKTCVLEIANSILIENPEWFDNGGLIEVSVHDPVIGDNQTMKKNNPDYLERLQNGYKPSENIGNKTSEEIQDTDLMIKVAKSFSSSFNKTPDTVKDSESQINDQVTHQPEDDLEEPESCAENSN